LYGTCPILVDYNLFLEGKKNRTEEKKISDDCESASVEEENRWMRETRQKDDGFLFLFRLINLTLVCVCGMLCLEDYDYDEEVER
jgi:hypothetical protein